MRVRAVIWPGLFLCLASVSFLAGQEPTRAQEYENLRKQKPVAAPSRPGKIEGAMLWLQERKIQEKLETPGAGFNGFRPKLGGLSTGSGFAFGALYDRVQMLEQADFSLIAAASLRKYQLYQLKLDLPRLASERVFVSTTARYRAMPQEDYFGPGPDSVKTDRTNYLYEDSSFGVRGGVHPKPWLRLEAAIDYLKLNVGVGTDPRFASTEQVFNDLNTPGLDHQGHFLKSEFTAAIDTRDSPGNPRSGGYYAASHTTYDDRKLNASGFQRFEAEAQQYVPFNAGHRVIAFRFASSFDDAESGQRVPFYLQLPLGGSNDIRGYRESRFRDTNRMVSNLEYRWEAFSGLDMAIFGDAGKVFSDRGDFDLHHLKTSYGLGFRFNTAQAVIWRIDIARSREGTRVFMKFDNVF